MNKHFCFYIRTFFSFKIVCIQVLFYLCCIIDWFSSKNMPPPYILLNKFQSKLIHIRIKKVYVQVLQQVSCTGSLHNNYMLKQQGLHLSLCNNIEFYVALVFHSFYRKHRNNNESCEQVQVRHISNKGNNNNYNCKVTNFMLYKLILPVCIFVHGIMLV